MSLTQNQATVILRNLGWRIRSTNEYIISLKNFQAAWNLGAALSADGKCGPKTSAALLLSESRRRVGKTTASPNFSFSEVKCRCGGKYSSCQRIFQKRAAFRMMESYRARTGRALTVVSACRCLSHNASIGSDSKSRHVNGLACDVAPVYSVATVRSWRLATNIGYGSKSRKVRHIDVGPQGSISNPRSYVDGR